ncbi:family 78 glycoside hydrolase catalytic domain [Nocardioides sp. SYSU D00038]|uniref:family 78 glycoside hydrolase catalytic domain n=1 Tax=Nocardioides sp. SYSU D00038 TaxID=2812554 RepID=UPI001967852A|nr:family 78 glycoside hydrolase catalytic domain [Nocardioides sp. SYSU D00038]
MGALTALAVLLSSVLTTVAVALAPAPASAAVAADAVSLTSLEVEKKVRPIGIDVAVPRFSWVVEASARGVVQEGYRLRVATAGEGLDGELTWDSGEVDSPESANVAYDGPALASATGYVWRVDVVTSAGTASAESSFRTGLREADWDGSAWIGNDRPARTGDLTLAGASWIHPPYTGANTPPGWFRRTFEVPAGKTIETAQLVMTGDRGFSAFLNGTQVASGASVDDRWKQAVRVDVRPAAGSNVLAVRLNNTAKAYGAVVGKLVISYTDGTDQTVVTDGTWLSTTAVPTPGWDRAGYPTTGWVAASARAVYGGSPWGNQVSVPAVATPDVSMNVDTASWIIPPVVGEPSSANPIPSTVFRRTVTVDPAKEVAWAQLSVTGDQIFKAFWNGQQVAFNTGANNEWQVARTVNLVTTPGANVLGLQLTTPAASANSGVLARVRIGYTDGTSEDVVTDSTFKALAHGSAAPPEGWSTVGFDDSAWPAARARYLYRGGVYGDRVTVPQLPNGAESLSFLGASWIWAPEANQSQPPGEDRAFRRTLVTPEGKEAVRADVLITADDSFRLYVNGTFLGATEGAVNEWQQSHLYEVDLEPDRNLVAVRTTNGPGSFAGLVAAVRVHYADGSSEVVRTDTSWKVTKQIPADYPTPSLDDSGWSQAVVQAAYGGAPWGSQVKPPKDPVDPAPLLRKEFEVDGEVADATIYYAAGGYADVSLNGAPISDEVLSPGFTDYDDTVQYAATDVTDQLTQGANALGMELGRGFYGMTGGNVWRWEAPPWHDEPVVRAVLEVEYADGRTERVVTDDSWTIHDGPTRFDDLYGGELYDAARVQPGYDTTGFDDSRWAAASEVVGPKGELVNMRQQPIRVTEELPAVEITEPADDTYVVKFPRVLAGWVEVTAEGPAGTTIRYQHGEKLLDSGLVNFSNNGGFQAGFQTDRFVLAGTGAPETFEPSFSYKGFQYIQVTGWPGTEAPPLSAFTAKAVHTDAPRTGSFESSDPTMNATHEAVVDTMLNNLHGIPTDTPMFEKNGWTGDAAVGAEMFMLNLDVHELFAKWMRDLHETRDEEGAPMVIAPSSGDWGEWGVAPPWHSAYVMIPWWLFQYGGDDRVLREQYDGMKAYTELEFGRSDDGLVVSNRLGDWVSPEASPAGGNAPEDARLSGTAYLYAMLTSMQGSAEHLGRPADAAHFAEQAAVVKEAFNDSFLDTARGLYRGNGDNGYRQTHNVLALAFGLTPDAATADRVADSIVADVRAKGVHLNTGVLGTKYLLPVLTDSGHADLAYELAVQKTYPSWGYMIEQGATSMWEHWALAARSRGHYFLGTVDDWFFKYVGGIRASATTGYRDVTVAPAVTDRLDWARTTTDTPYGPVTSDWRHENGDLLLDVTVPVGSTATVVVPAENLASVVEGDGLASRAEGVTAASYADGAVTLRVGSGHYELRVDQDLAVFGRVLDRIAEAQGRADAHHAAGDLADADHASLTAGLAGLADDVDDAVGGVLAGDQTAVDSALAAALAAARALRDATEASSVDAPVRGDLVLRLDRVVAALEAVVSTRLGVEVAVVEVEGDVLPGDVVPGTVTVTNSGDTTLTDLAATVAVDDWDVDASGLTLDSLAPGATATLPFTATVPVGATTGQRTAAVTLAYSSGDDSYTVTGSGPWVRVVAGVSVTGVVATVPDPAQPRRARAVVTLANVGDLPVDGHVELVVPDGWGPTVPSGPVSVPAGGTLDVEVPLWVPRRVVATSHPVQARLVRNGEVVAEGGTTLAVALATPPTDALDHVDFGEPGSETAHAVQAGPNSGTSSEAGLTRRYAHSLFPGSWYSALLDVRPGEPFALRMIETFDKATTKEFNLYVDDVPVGRHTVTRTQNSVGWMAHELVVDAAAAVAQTADGEVRLKFEFPTDAAGYDPSIADAWTLPVAADDLAPLASARVLATRPGRHGWQRGPASVKVVAVDDRPGATTVEVGGDGWQPYTGPVEVSGDGEHRVDWRAEDAAGNGTGLRSTLVRIDATAPTTSLSVGATAEGDARATVRIAATDATSGVAGTLHRVDGGPWQPLLGDSVVVTGFGEHVVEAWSTDVAGNTEVVRTLTVTLSDVAALEPLAGPEVRGAARVGATLTATDGTWNTGGVTVTRQWLRNGAPVAGATAATYRVGAADIGARLAVRVTASKTGRAPATATSAPTAVVAKVASTSAVRAAKQQVRPGRAVTVRVRVTAAPLVPGGQVAVVVDGRTVRTVRATGQWVEVSVRLRGKGVHRIRAVYAGSATALPSRSSVVKVRVR